MRNMDIFTAFVERFARATKRAMALVLVGLWVCGWAGMSQGAGIILTPSTESTGDALLMAITNVECMIQAYIPDPLPVGAPGAADGWTQVSGPATVVLGDTNANPTTATFPAVGTYHLLFTASEVVGATTYSGSGSVIIEVIDPARIAIIKADDFWGVEDPWTAFIERSRALGIKMSAGVVTDQINSSDYAFMRTQEAEGDVEFWNHGKDHSKASDDSWFEFSGQTTVWMEEHMSTAQAVLATVLQRDCTAFGPAYNQFDATAAAVLNATPELNLLFARSSQPGVPFVDDRIAVVGIISESDGTGNPNASAFITSYPNGPAGPVSLQFHPHYIDAGERDEYAAIVNYLLGKGYTFLMPAEYVTLLDGALIRESGVTPPTSTPFDITTADGNGADALISETDGTSGGNGTAAHFYARFNGVNRNEFGLLRFDLSAIKQGTVQSAELKITLYADETDTGTFNCYGVGDGAPGQDWVETSVTFDGAPGVTFDGDSSTRSRNDTVLTLLASASATTPSDGDVLTFNATALKTFLNADTDGEVTLLIERDNTNSVLWQFDSKEHPDAPATTPTLSLLAVAAPVAAPSTGTVIIVN